MAQVLTGLDFRHSWDYADFSRVLVLENKSQSVRSDGLRLFLVVEVARLAAGGRCCADVFIIVCPRASEQT